MISVHRHEAVGAAVRALEVADQNLKNDLYLATVQTMGPVWKDVLADRAIRFHRDVRLYLPGGIIAGNNPKATAATETRTLSGGLVPAKDWPKIEFGSNREKQTTYDRRSPKGKVHKVTRRTQRQLPPRYRKGRVAYPAFAEVAPRVVSLWVQMIIRRYNEALEKAV